jgi:hypothetical protein
MEEPAYPQVKDKSSVSPLMELALMDIDLFNVSSFGDHDI